MKCINLLQINLGNYGSTGMIMAKIGETIEQLGGDSYYAFPDSRTNRKKEVEHSVLIGTRFERNLHLQLANFTGLNGCFSIFSTFRFLRKIDSIKPDIIHLHNLHNCYINLPIFFRYLKKNTIPVVWTLHDCWAFTGQCPHFSAIGCNKWETGCYSCPQYMLYPESRVDRTKFMYKKKKQWFTGLPNLTLITPSRWLAGCVKDSFLREYEVKVIQNGIDLEIFKPTASSFKKKYQCESKTIVLGVAFGWSERKGLDIFIELEQLLPENYQIVIVGVSEDQKKILPDKYIALGLTSNVKELVEIYSAADVLLNPSKEETMGLVTVEALACGTPVVVSNLTAVPEVVSPECGIIVEEFSSKAFASALINMPNFLPDKCIKQAKKFDKKNKYNEYVDLYTSIMKS